MRHAALALAALALCVPLAASAQAAARLEPVWTLTGLEDPESVALGPDGRTLYVANVPGEGDAKDGRAAGTYVNDFVRIGERLIVPSWKPGSLTAYRIR